MFSRFPEVALLLALWAHPARAQASDGAVPALDPDRGLDEALRARLALADPLRDTVLEERCAAQVMERLQLVAELWSTNRLAQGLAAQVWIAPELRVTGLGGDPSVAGQVRDEWSLAHTSAAPAETAGGTALAPAFAAWRARFPGESRLDCEVFAIDTSAFEAETRFTAQVRVRASGPLAGACAQHDALWTSAWRLLPAGLEWTSLRVEHFESVTLAQHAQGLFADVTESACGAALFRAEVAPGLDDWRRVVPAALEPGSLGHHGLALGDVDADGREDVYWCRPGGLPNKLFLHAPDDTLRDASAAAGVDLLDYSSSALLSDLDGDADADLVVATATGLVFYANDGRAHFEQKLYRRRSLATSLAAADYDRDGDLDLYACSYISPYEASGTPVPYHDANNGEANQLLRNDGAWSFADATVELGLDANNRRFSLAAAWEDYDNDGDADLFVANDFGTSNLYRNDGARFVDVAPELGASNVAAGMGVTWGDVDGDGWMDAYITNMYSPAGSRLTARPGFRSGSSVEIAQAYRHHSQGNVLLLNGRGGAFRDVSEASGTALGRWGWGALFLEFDNDGALDLFAPNGFVSGERRADLDSFFWRQVVLRSPDGAGEPGESYALGWRAARRLVRQGWSWNGHERNAAFLGLGAASFADVSSVTGLDFADDARAAARVDWDGDGDEDLLVTNRTAPMLRLLSNQQSSGRHWIELTLRARARTAIGARVELESTDARRQLRTLRCGEGYLAQSSSRLHFGLGAEGVRALRVRWPGGALEEFGAPASDAAYALEEGTGRALSLAARTTASRLAPGPVLSASSGPSRIVLPAPLPLPRLALETADGRAASLLGISMQGPRGTGQPLLLVVWSSAEPACARELARLVSASAALTSHMQVLALASDEPARRAEATAQLDALAWPFARGFASAEALQILELVAATLRDDAHALELPAAFLVDPGGRLAVSYLGALDPERARADLALFELSPAARRDACVPFPGRWLAPPPAVPGAAVAARLAAHGLERPAAEYRLAQVETRALSQAQELYEQAVGAHREGRLADAIALYRRALGADPACASAAQDLAVALHQQGDRPAALAAYKDALRLDPAHALTRCNLGYLYLDLADVAGARNELEALRTLKSELAVTLEARIREVEKP